MDSAFGGRSSSLNRSAVACASGVSGVGVSGGGVSGGGVAAGGVASGGASAGASGLTLANHPSLSSVHQCKTANPTLASLANLLSSSDSAKLQEHVMNIRESVREREREEERQRESMERAQRERSEDANERVQQRVRVSLTAFSTHFQNPKTGNWNFQLILLGLGTPTELLPSRVAKARNEMLTQFSGQSRAP